MAQKKNQDKRHSGIRKATVAKAGKRSQGKGKNKSPKYQQQGKKFTFGALAKDRQNNSGKKHNKQRAKAPKLGQIAGDQIKAIKEQEKEQKRKQKQQQIEVINRKLGKKFDPTNQQDLEKLGLIKRNK